MLSTLICPNTHTKTLLVCVLGQISVLNMGRGYIGEEEEGPAEAAWSGCRSAFTSFSFPASQLVLIVNLTSVKQSEAGRPRDEATVAVHTASYSHRTEPRGISDQQLRSQHQLILLLERERDSSGCVRENGGLYSTARR